MLTIFADPLRFAMATIHRGVDYANSNGLASLDGAGSTWPANGPPARQAVLSSQFAMSSRRYEVARYYLDPRRSPRAPFPPGVRRNARYQQPRRLRPITGKESNSTAFAALSGRQCCSASFGIDRAQVRHSPPKLGARADLKLLVDAGEFRLDGLRADPEGGRDFAVRAAAGRQLDDCRSRPSGSAPKANHERSRSGR